MALKRDRKEAVVAEVSELLAASKMTVMAAYTGTPVKAMQALRKQAAETGTTVHVIKNRLVIKALQQADKTAQIDTSVLTGMLLYAFNPDDEVMPAQILAKFAKTQPTLEFVGGIAADGSLISAADIKALAVLPSKQQLRGQLVGTLAAPLSGFVNVLSGNLRGLLNVLSGRADSVAK